MITDDEVMRLFERADPARVDQIAPMIDAHGYLDTLQTRSNNMTIIETRPLPTRRPGRHRWPIIAAAAAIVLIAVGALILAVRDDRAAPGNDDIPATTAAPTNTVNSRSLQTAADFLAAYGAFDADRALTYLADGASIAELTGGQGTTEDFRLDLAWLRATGFKQTLQPCQLMTSSFVGDVFRCPYDYHGFRSDEIGRGPFSGSYYNVTVDNGKVVSASGVMSTDNFSPQMWEPFADWVSTTYPDDAARMYTNETHTVERITAESIPLWDQHVRDYIQHVKQLAAPPTTQ